MRIRLRLTKENSLRYVSHLDFVRLVERAIRVGRVPVAYTEGYNPRPKIAYSPALPVGISSETEFVDVWLTIRRDPRAIACQLSNALPPGARVLGAREIPATAKALTAIVTDAQYRVRIPIPAGNNGKELAERIANICQQYNTGQSLGGMVFIVSRDPGMVTLGMILPSGSRRGPKVREVVAEILAGLGWDVPAGAVDVHRSRLLYGGEAGTPRALEV